MVDVYTIRKYHSHFSGFSLQAENPQFSDLTIIILHVCNVMIIVGAGEDLLFIRFNSGNQVLISRPSLGKTSFSNRLAGQIVIFKEPHLIVIAPADEYQIFCHRRRAPIFVYFVQEYVSIFYKYSKLHKNINVFLPKQTSCHLL